MLPEFSESYTFHLTADDGVRLWVDDQLLIDRWSAANQIAGDANHDDTVNLADFNALALNFGAQGATWEQGDFSGDGTVNLIDFNLLAANFGHAAPPPAPVTDTATIALTAGQWTDIKLEYFDRSGPASVNLKWSSASRPLQVISRDRLSNAVQPNTFTNPVVPSTGFGADPWVTFRDGFYYFVHAEDAIGSTRIYIHKSPTLQGIGQAPAVQVWQSPVGTSYSTQVWAPELHFLDNGSGQIKPYIYFTGSNGSWFDHRMYVLEANTDDPQGAYTFRGKIALPSADYHAIDGSVFEFEGQHYFIWSGFVDDSGNTVQRVYMARMSDPLTLVGNRVLLSQPDQPWEITAVNEGPTAIVRDGKVFVTFSINNYWMSEYALAMVTYSGGDIMNPANWVKSTAPVFQQANGVAGVGHASFTTSPDEAEDWIVYHSMQSNGLRDVRIQRYSWNDEGSPNFGQPVATGAAVIEPSGTPTFYAPAAMRSPLFSYKPLRWTDTDADDLLL